jgi:hypothetical protein
MNMNAGVFKHFLLTRFNVKTKWKTTKNGEETLTEKWLSHRFDLFEKFCYPSVRNQKNQGFRWLVFFDINTPTPYKERISDLAREYQNTCHYLSRVRRYCMTCFEIPLSLT